jgi:hypothetical protein
MASNGVFYSGGTGGTGLDLTSGDVTRINISTGGVIKFNNDYTFPTSDGSTNTVLLTNGSGSLSFSTIPNASLDNSSFTLGSTSISLGDTASSIAGLTSITADTVYANSVLRISQNGDGLRMTNVGAFDNDGSDNFRIFSNNDLILSTNGDSGTAVTFDSTSKDATFQGQVIAPTISATTANISGDISVGTLGNTNDILIVGSGKTITSTDVLSINPTSKFVGINQSSPEVTLHMTGEGAQTAQIRMEQYNDSADAPDVRTRRYRGTAALPAAIQAGDYLYRSNHEYYNGTSLIVGGQFAFDNTNNANRTQFTIAVTTDGTSVEASSNDDVQFKIDGNDSGAITFNDAYKFPTSDGSANTVLLTNGSGSLSFSTIPNASLDNSSLTVTAGDGLTNGGSVSLGSSVTLNVGAGTGISVAADTVGLDTSNTRNVDHSSVSISAGTGLSGGGTIASNRTISLDYAGTNNFIDSATNLEGTSIATSDTIIYHDATDNNVKKGLISDLPFSNNSGTVTSVTVGTGLDVSNGTTTPNITLDLSELATSTTNGDGDFFVVVDSSNVQRKLTKGNINISGFNNDAGYTTNTGTVTSVDISGTDGIDVDSGSPITGSGTIQLGLSNVPNSSLANSSVEVVGGNGLTGGGTVALGGSVTLNVGAGTLIDVDGSNVNVDLSELATSTSNGDGDYFVVVDTANAQKKLTKGNINISGFNNDAGYITSAGNTNIYNTDGSLSADRILNQTEFQLNFRAASNEYFQAFKSNGTPIGTPRVRFEADDEYETVLELQSSGPSTFLINAYDVGNAPVFNVDGNGNLFAVSKSFLIEHPSDSSMSLRHGSLEGPEHGVYVRGKLDGSNTIELPSYWLDLVDEDSITVQLTPIGSHQNLYVKDIVDNKVIVANSALLSSKVKCFYFVQAERKDIDKMIVEYPKGTQTI